MNGADTVIPFSGGSGIQIKAWVIIVQYGVTGLTENNTFYHKYDPSTFYYDSYAQYVNDNSGILSNCVHGGAGILLGVRKRGYWFIPSAVESTSLRSCIVYRDGNTQENVLSLNMYLGNTDPLA